MGQMLVRSQEKGGLRNDHWIWNMEVLVILSRAVLTKGWNEMMKEQEEKINRQDFLRSFVVKRSRKMVWWIQRKIRKRRVLSKNKRWYKCVCVLV